jgi:hypothetical protein
MRRLVEVKRRGREETCGRSRSILQQAFYTVMDKWVSAERVCLVDT